MSINFDVSGISETGGRLENEDAYVIHRIEGGVVAAVADGLGGHIGGKRASTIATECLTRSQTLKTDSLKELSLEIHRLIKAEQSLGGQTEMATTLSVVRVIDDQLEYSHVGDSRIAMARGQGIVRLTKDHSEVQRYVESGKLTQDEARDYPRKNILESALGMDGMPRVDTGKLIIIPGDRFYLTTDGAHNTVKLRELLWIGQRSSSAAQAVAAISDEIRARKPDDNFTCVCLICR